MARNKVSCDDNCRFFIKEVVKLFTFLLLHCKNKKGNGEKLLKLDNCFFSSAVHMEHHTHVGFFIMIGCDDRRVTVIDSIRGVVVLVLKRDLVALIPTRISSVPDT